MFFTPSAEARVCFLFGVVDWPTCLVAIIVVVVLVIGDVAANSDGGVRLWTATGGSNELTEGSVSSKSGGNVKSSMSIESPYVEAKELQESTVFPEKAKLSVASVCLSHLCFMIDASKSRRSV